MAYERILKEHDVFIIPIGQQASDEFKILSQASDDRPDNTVVQSPGEQIFLELEIGTSLLAQEESTQFFILLEGSTDVADQIEVQIPLSRVPEETTFTLTSYHRTRAAKSASVPTTIHYRIDCITTKRQITDWTSVSNPAQSNTIVITSTENQILDDSNNRERKQITIKLDSGLATQVMRTKTWTVENLLGVY
jgi:hypothetical protein